MKLFILCAILCFAGITLAQLSAGNQWRGIWNSNKRDGSFESELYICVEHDKAYGVYSNIGIMTGSLRGNVFRGEWFEAGYDTPFGNFELTISGGQFSGSWNYQGGNTTFSWSGNRLAGTEPTAAQCLKPATGATAEGTFENLENICVGTETYQNTDQQFVIANFDGFGTVAGYTPNSGSYILLSDFYYQSGESVDDFRPEGNDRPFGPCSDCDSDNDRENHNLIQTTRIGIAAMIDDKTLCGYFWDGFYNDMISSGPICFDKTNTLKPSEGSCGSEDSFYFTDLGNTELILSEIQSVLDHIELPPVVLLSGVIVDDDDEDFPPGYFDQFLTTIPDDDDDNNDDDDDNNGDDDDVYIVYVPVKVPTPVPVPVPIPVPVPVPYVVYVNGGDDDDDNSNSNNAGDDDDVPFFEETTTSDSTALTASVFIILSVIVILA